MGTAQQGIHPGMLTQAQTEQVLRMAAAQAQVRPNHPFNFR